VGLTQPQLPATPANAVTLTSINGATATSVHNFLMFPDDRPSSPVLNGHRIAERLLAYARLCRQIAEATQNEDLALDFRRLADECRRVAANADPGRAGPRLI
jgi:hypothetical protein